MALSNALRARPRLAYSVSVIMFALSLFARLELMEELPQGFPYLTFFPAVILTAFFCGTLPSALCALLSGLAAWYWLITPGQPFSFSGGALLALAFFAFIVIVDIVLIHFMHSTGTRLLREQRVIRELYDRQNVMFAELQHRVANNMQFISSILYLGKQNIRKGADPVEVLKDAQQRLQGISRIHRRLYDPSRADLPVSACLAELCEDLMEISDNPQVRCEVEPSEARLDLTRLTTLSMLVAELVTNALKHAFPDDQPGLITVSLQPVQPEGYRLVISDNGKGFTGPDGHPDPRSLGLKIIASFAAQLGATPVWRNDQGTQVEMVFR